MPLFCEVLRPSISLKPSCRVWRLTPNNCLRQLVGVRIADRQPLDKIREACGLLALRQRVVKRTMSWLGHVARMHPTRSDYSIWGQAGSNPRAQPKHSHKHTHQHLISLAGFDNKFYNTWPEVVQDRIGWRHMWQGVDLAQTRPGSRPPLRLQSVRAARLPSASLAKCADRFHVVGMPTGMRVIWFPCFFTLHRSLLMKQFRQCF